MLCRKASYSSGAILCKSAFTIPGWTSINSIEPISDTDVYAIASNSAWDIEYRLYHWDGNELTYEDFPEGFTSGSMDAGGTNDLWIAGRSAIIPEPATLTLLALGGLALIRRRK